MGKPSYAAVTKARRELSALVIVIVLLAAGIFWAGITAADKYEALRQEIQGAKLDAARAAAAATISIEYDAVLQSLIAKMQEYSTINKFDEREITGLARLILEQVAFHRDAGLTPAVVMSIMEVESGFDPDAQSSALAYGIMQVQRFTARPYLEELGYNEWTPDLLKDPLIGTRVGIEYWVDLHRMFVNEGLEDVDDFEITASAYNWGPGAVRRLLAGDDAPADLKYAMMIRRRLPFYTERGLN